MKCKILLSFTYRNHLDQLNDYTEEFLSIPDFKNYLRWEPVKAMLIGYGPIVQEKLENARVSNVKLSISLDGYLVNFENVHAFAGYLKKNKEVAKALQFKI